MSDQIIEFVRLRDAAEEVCWHPRHLYRVLTEPDYSHFDPRPKIRRLNGRYQVLVRSEWELFKAYLAEDGLKPPAKKTKLSESRHQARLAREQQGASA